MSYIDAFNKLKKNVKHYSNMLLLASQFTQEAKDNTSRFKNPTGKLKSSVNFGGNEKKAYAKTDLPYAKIQDIGGIIRPKNAKMLKIPLVDNPSDSDLFILKKNDNLFLMNKSNERIEYVLKPQVRIKGTNWWTDAWNWVNRKVKSMRLI